eukprot:scaffold120663_cov36-Tisochrysis_lutea.AAC.2
MSRIRNKGYTRDGERRRAVCNIENRCHGRARPDHLTSQVDPLGAYTTGSSSSGLDFIVTALPPDVRIATRTRQAYTSFRFLTSDHRKLSVAHYTVMYRPPATSRETG